MIPDLLLALGIFIVTVLSGMPFALTAGRRTLTRIAFSFALGYVLLSLAGILGALLGIDPIFPQMLTVLAGALLCSRLYLLHRDELHDAVSLNFDRTDWIVLGSWTLYLVMCILFFDRLIMWMAGDAVAHAEMLRMLIDGHTLPVKLPLLGDYWEYYPKGFHYYAYLWAKAFPVIDVIQTLPVLITAATPLILYSVMREMKQEAVSVYAFLLATFAFSTHYSYLIWGGYPSAAAEMLLVAAVLAAVLKMRLLLMALALGMLLSHPRILALGMGILLAYCLAEWLRRHLTLRHLSILGGGLLFLAAGWLWVHRPEYLLSVFSDQDLASQFVARWYPAFLAVFGAAIALIRQERLDRMALVWAGSMIIIILLADSGPLSFLGTADRLLLPLYLPLSLLAALALCRMDGGDARIRASFLLILISIGVASTGLVLYSYAGSWGLPEQDYDAMIWLSQQNLSDAVCINLDQTGAWVYPLTGIKTSCPRVAPTGFSCGLSERIRWDPGNRAAIDELKSIGHENALIYVSSVSILRPGHMPPFAGHDAFPLLNLSFSQADYELLYDDGARIYRAWA